MTAQQNRRDDVTSQPATVSPPEITSARARVRVAWTVDYVITPGSVPDRPCRIVRTGTMYRPDQLQLEFLAIGTSEEGVAALSLAGPRMTRDVCAETVLNKVTISGPKVGKGGQPRKDRHDEISWSRPDSAPDWARPVIDAALSALTGAGGHQAAVSQDGEMA